MQKSNGVKQDKNGGCYNASTSFPAKNRFTESLCENAHCYSSKSTCPAKQTNANAKQLEQI
jgi:hypothetical protein